MPKVLARVDNYKKINGKEYNLLVDAINRIRPIHMTGNLYETTTGTAIRSNNLGVGASVSREIFIAKVLSSATGGGYYNCALLQSIVGTKDTSTTPQFKDLNASLILQPNTLTFSDNDPDNDTISYTGELGPSIGWMVNGMRRGMQVAITETSLNNITITINGLTETVITCDPSDSLTDETDTQGVVTMSASAIVLNLNEYPIPDHTGSHKLEAGDILSCWNHQDEDGNTVLMGTGMARYGECP